MSIASACLFARELNSHAEVGSGSLFAPFACSFLIVSQCRSFHHCSFSIILFSRFALPSLYFRKVSSARAIDSCVIGPCSDPLSGSYFTASASFTVSACLSSCMGFPSSCRNASVRAAISRSGFLAVCSCCCWSRISALRRLISSIGFLLFAIVLPPIVCKSCICPAFL